MAREVIRLTGIPYSTLNLWARTGLLVPTVARATGSGTERIYSLGDLVAIRLAMELRHCGASTKSIKQVIDFLRNLEPDHSVPADARLVVTGADVVLVRNESQLVSVLKRPGQGCLQFVIDVPHTIRDIKSTIAAVPAIARAISGIEDEPGLKRKNVQSAKPPQLKRGRR